MCSATASIASPHAPPEYGYHLLKVALETFKKNLSQLDPQQLHSARRKADKSFEIESLVLASPEAGGVTVEQSQVEAAVREIAGRYASPEDFVWDLQRNGLDEQTLRRSLHRELLFDGVMQRVGACRAQVNDLDICLFYEIHRERFAQPERRVARHILITVNPEYPENTRESALARIERVRERLGDRASRFANLARRHSECPSALEGGKLGGVTRGQLFPVLGSALFALAEGEISGILESEIGFHILWCEKIQPGRTESLSRVRPQITRILEQRKQRNCQKAWLAELRRSRSDQEAGS